MEKKLHPKDFSDKNNVTVLFQVIQIKHIFENAAKEKCICFDFFVKCDRVIRFLNLEFEFELCTKNDCDRIRIYARNNQKHTLQ